MKKPSVILPTISALNSQILKKVIHILKDSLEVAIFSYNRGKYLKNCVDSLLKNLPDVIISVYDDNSDDRGTLDYLESLGDIVKSSRTENTSRHGNLYKNMQTALDNSTKRFLILLQDDTQIVRPVNDFDLASIGKIFDDNKVGFLRAHFIKQGTSERITTSMTPNNEYRAYIPNLEFENGAAVDSYFDVVICDVVKLKAISWQFQYTEKANQKQSQVHFRYMPILADGFVFFCPEVPCYRNKKMFWASKIAQKKLKGGISALKTMSKAQNANFISRDINIWPIAEDFIEATNPDVKKPFVFQDYSKSKWLLLLYKIESGLFKTIQSMLSITN